MGFARRVVSDMQYRIMTISVQPKSETTVQHIICHDILGPDISVQIKDFDRALSERLDDTNFIINDFYGFGVEDEGGGMPQ